MDVPIRTHKAEEKLLNPGGIFCSRIQLLAVDSILRRKHMFVLLRYPAPGPTGITDAYAQPSARGCHVQWSIWELSATGLPQGLFPTHWCKFRTFVHSIVRQSAFFLCLTFSLNCNKIKEKYRFLPPNYKHLYLPFLLLEVCFHLRWRFSLTQGAVILFCTCLSRK